MVSKTLQPQKDIKSVSKWFKRCLSFNRFQNDIKKCFKRASKMLQSLIQKDFKWLTSKQIFNQKGIKMVSKGCQKRINIKKNIKRHQQYFKGASQRFQKGFKSASTSKVCLNLKKKFQKNTKSVSKVPQHCLQSTKMQKNISDKTKHGDTNNHVV